MKIAIIGIGYVDFCNNIPPTQYNDVAVIDIDSEKADMFNCEQSPIEVVKNEDNLTHKQPNIKASLHMRKAHIVADYITFALPTGYDPVTNNLKTCR
jgi:UDP-glucose 6-dehydrogenase